MTNFLNINGWRVPVTSCELQPVNIGNDERTLSGNLLRQRRSVKRKWDVTTAPMTWEDANAMWQLVQGRGHQWKFNGSTSPQDTTATNLKSSGGLLATNSPTFTLERSAAVDGDSVFWAYSTANSATPQAFGGSGLFVSKGTTNLLSSDTASAENAPTGYNTVNSATLSADTTHKWQGSKSVKCVTGNVSSVEGVTTADFTTVVATTYTCSAYVKCATGGVVLNATFNRTDTGGIIASQTFTTIANVWVRVFVSGAAATTGSRFRIQTTSQSALTFYVDGWQAEVLTAPAFTATPWVNGTRSASVGPAYPTSVVSSLTSFTFSSWARTYGRAADEDRIIEFGQADQVNHAILYLSSGIPRFSIFNGSGQNTLASAGATIPATSSWYHILGTFDAVNGTVKLYVNGALAQSTTYSNALPDFSTVTSFRIGCWAFGTSNQAIAGIDEITLLPFAAPSGLVTALYNGSAVPWPVLPKLYVTGDAVDGTAICVGNTDRGTFTKVFRSGGLQKNNIMLSFSLEEV